MASKNKQRKRKALFSGVERGVVAKLTAVEQMRRRFERLSQELTARTLSGLALAANAHVVEIGSGTGQLRSWLPETVRASLVHTEPLELAIRHFQARFPDVAIAKASADKLPFPDAQVDAVLGLCVMDVVQDGAAIAKEIARVLRPGGAFVHWLDLSTELKNAFALVAESSFIPLPNVFSDPSAAPWPEDLFLTPRKQVAWICELLARHREPLAAPLAKYLGIFATKPFGAQQAVLEFNQLAESAPLRAHLRQLFSRTFELASPDERSVLVNFRGQPAASSRFFERKLREWFCREQGFEVEHADIVTASERIAAPESAPLKYFSLCVGEMRDLPTPPAALLCAASDADASPDTMLLELGMFCFVARRV